jgi:hypothetical protein
MRKSKCLHLIVLMVIGCTRQSPQSTTSSPQSAPPMMAEAGAPAPIETQKAKDVPGGTFSHEPSAITISWPAGWEQKQFERFECAIFPAGESSQERWISLDVPDLPIHVPGLIPIGKVANGYINDLKKKFGNDIEIKDLPPPNVPECKQRLVRASWKKDGKQIEQTALLMVHTDHVYIIRARSPVEQEQPTRETFDAVVSSIRWRK